MGKDKPKLSKNEKRILKQKQRFLSHNFEYLTLEIANTYKTSAKHTEKFSKEWNELRNSLRGKYGLQDIEAINVLNGEENLIDLYVKVYEQIKNFDIRDYEIADKEIEEIGEEFIEVDLDLDINMQIDDYIFEEKD